MSNSLKLLDQKLLTFPTQSQDQSHDEEPRRKNRKLRKGLGAIAFILLPTLIAAVYYGVIATERYVSTAKMTVKSADSSSAAMNGMLGGMLSGVSSGQSEAYAVQEYIQSEQIVIKLHDWLNLKKTWSQESIDPVSRLSPDATTTDLHKYYNSMVQVDYLPEKSVINLKVQGYSAEDASGLATAIIALSEDLVNQMSAQIQTDAVSFAKEEVARAEARLEQARLKVKRFQNENGQLDPAARAKSIGGIVSELESRLAQVRAEISAKSTYMRDSSAQMEALKAQKAALNEQLERERERLAGERSQPGQEQPYSDLLARYEELRIQEEFARKAYEMAQSTLESARMDASRKQIYLVDFVEPSVPDKATKPETARNVAVTAIGSALVLGILVLTIGAIREHAQS